MAAKQPPKADTKASEHSQLKKYIRVFLAATFLQATEVEVALRPFQPRDRPKNPKLFILVKQNTAKGRRGGEAPGARRSSRRPTCPGLRCQKKILPLSVYNKSRRTQNAYKKDARVRLPWRRLNLFPRWCAAVCRGLKNTPEKNNFAEGNDSCEQPAT